jgi:hypothetical protein
MPGGLSLVARILSRGMIRSQQKFQHVVLAESVDALRMGYATHP